MKPEILTTENNERFCLFPIKYHDMWDQYKNHKNTFWSVEEIDMSIDRKEWGTLSDNEKTFIENILAFFANSDSIVLENLCYKFLSRDYHSRSTLFLFISGNDRKYP